jgi:dipeptidyl aminopeptidase/acylaminoacyl peptidase
VICEEVDETLSAPSDRWPQLLPDGDTVIFTRTEHNSDYSRAEIVALSLADMSVKTLVTGATFGRFVPPGFLVYTRSSTMFAVRFDPRTLEVIGSAVPVIDDLVGAPSWGSSQFVVSDDGMLIYLEGGIGGEVRQLVWIDRDGNEQPASAHERAYDIHSVSPDGKYVALVIPAEATGSRDIWLLELERDTLTRLTFHERWDTAPSWSPDGRWITFASPRGNGPQNLYRKRSDGTGEVERLTTSDNPQVAGSWSPDGTVLAFTQLTEEGGLDLMLLRPGGEPEVEVFLATPFAEYHPRISPDGRWMAYVSDASGQPEVYVRPLAGEGRQVQVSTAGARDCAWSPDGTELLYRSPSREMMAVRFTVDSGEFRPALPEELFAIDPAYRAIDDPAYRSIDVSPDGMRFLANREPGGPGARRDEPVVVVNWVEELKQRLESR